MSSQPTHQDHNDHAHPTEKQYWIIFVVLAVVTAIEVAWSYLGFEGPAEVLPLIAMMVFKFILVGAIFMHLYFDGKVPGGKTFTYVFGAGLVIALLVFFVVFATFEFRI